MKVKVKKPKACLEKINFASCGKLNSSLLVRRSLPEVDEGGLKREFYQKSTLKVAQDLLGKFLIHQIGKKKIIGKITETEAYVGPRDKASHTSRGQTPRTALMFGQGGYTYIYLIYGMYYCFNVVTEKKDYPAAVLVRAVEPIFEGETPASRLRTDGPGKVCRFMKIDKRLNGIDLTGNVLWIEDRGLKIKKSQISRGKRIGVDYAGEYKNKLWRFYLSPHQN